MRSDEMERQVERFLQRFQAVSSDCSLIAACSGGRDSVCLLHILSILQVRLGYKLKAVYVHHGLRQEADEEAGWLKALCEEKQIGFAVRYADVAGRAARERESVEEAARHLRYQLLEEEAEKEERQGQTVWILTAHHGKDQAETVLLHLLRGCGLKGLVGMEERRGRILRPFLSMDREEIDRYVQENHLEYREDTSNQDIRYTRNWIRCRLLPVLKEQNPSVNRNLCEMASLLRLDEEYLESQANQLLPDVLRGDSLQLDVLKKQPEAIRYRIFRMYLEEWGGLRNVSLDHIRLLDGLMSSQSGAQAQLPGGRIFRREFDRIRPVREQAFSSGEAELNMTGERVQCRGIKGSFSAQRTENPYRNFKKIPNLRYTKWVDCDTITGRLLIRTRRPGDYLTAGGGRQRLKKFMINQKIALDERDRIPLVADGAHILWIVGYRLSDLCRVGPDSERIVQINYYDEENPQEEVKSCRNQKKME